MKHSFVAVLSVLISIAYGQLLEYWNNDPYGNRPYFALAPSANSNLANFRSGAKQETIGEQPQRQSLLLYAKVSSFEATVEKLEEELKTKISETNTRVTDVADMLEETTALLSQTLVDIYNLKLERDAKIAVLEGKIDGYADDSTTKITVLGRKVDADEADTAAKIAVLEAKINAFTCTCAADDPTTINKIPTSCEDLKSVGNTKSGLYSIFVSKQVETVYCDFTVATTATGFQKWIGYQDIKSKPTYFYVQKTQTFSTENTPIPFELTVLNTGVAMDLGTGKFKAPVTGTYFFSFNGLAQFPVSGAVLKSLAVTLYHKGQLVARSQLNEVNAVSNMNYLSPVTIQTTLTLQATDEVWLQVDVGTGGGVLFDDAGSRYTHFTGWLLEEEIIL